MARKTHTHSNTEAVLLLKLSFLHFYYIISYFFFLGQDRLEHAMSTLAPTRRIQRSINGINAINISDRKVFLKTVEIEFVRFFFLYPPDCDVVEDAAGLLFMVLLLPASHPLQAH